MSDDEDVHSGSEEEEEMAPPEDSGPSEAELAMQKRRKGTAKSSDELDEDAQELLEANKLERAKMEEEIQELRERSQQRKKEREEQEREMAERRSEEEARRKQEEDDRKSKKEAEDTSRKAARDQKMAEFEKFKNPSKPNFVISKRDGVPGVPTDDSQGDESQGEKKSKEQVEAEKRAILAQRIQPLDISGFDVGKLTEKAKELNGLVYRLESDKYDLEKRFKEQQFDMMELADKARQMNQVGRGGLKRIQLTQDESDPIQEKFAGAPAKVEMYSKYERQKDKRKYTERHDVFHGATWIPPPDRILAYKNVIWDENTGLPSYQDIPGMERPAEEGEGEEE